MRLLLTLLLILTVVALPAHASLPADKQAFTHSLNQVELDPTILPEDKVAQYDALILHAESNDWLEQTLSAVVAKVDILLSLERLQSAQLLIEQYLPMTNKDTLVEPFVQLLTAQMQINFTQNKSTTHIQEQLFSLLSSIKDPKVIASVYSSLGNQYYSRRQFEQALTYHNLAREQYQKINFKDGLAETVNDLARIYAVMGEFKKANEYYEETLLIMQERGDRLNESIILYNIGHAYLKLKEFDVAQRYFSDALTISHEINDVAGEAWATKALAKLFESQDNFEKALMYHAQALPLFEQNKDKRNILEVTLGKLNSYIELGNQSSAEQELQKLTKMVEELNGAKFQEKIDLKRQRAKLAALKQDFALAYQLQVEITTEIEGAHSKSNQQELNQLLVKFDIEKKENDNRLLQQENQLKELKLEQEQKESFIWRLALALITLVLIVIGYLLRKILINKNYFQTMALKDHLTNAPNRRAVLQTADRQFSAAKKNNQAITVAIIDLDFFKQVNDSFGHDAGDEVLVAFAKAIDSSIRGQDFFGRYGGEEWLLVLTNTSKEDISVVFNRIKENLSSIHIEHIPSDYELTFSLGAAELHKEDSTINDVIKRADDNLYQAKESGRNQYVA